MAKIASTDSKALNALFRSELNRTKLAEANVSHDESSPDGPQAFADHEEYVKTLESVLADDKKGGSWSDPNDVVLD